ncbi:MAG: metallophosphoesterase [Caldisericaceae bacterium]
MKLTIFVIFALLIYGVFIERNQLAITRLNFSKENSIKFVQISDLHFTREGKREKKILKIISNEHPDLVFITGDVVNFRKKFEAKKFFKKISALGIKTYFVLGNWDYKVKDVVSLKKEIESAGIKVLENETAEFTKNGLKINIIGLGDPFTNHDRFEEAVNSINNKNFSILLSHTPDIFYKAKEKGIDLILSGHLHGGQVCLPFCKFAIYTPSKYGTKFLRGIFKEGNTIMYVNRGIGESHFPIRIFSKPEILIGTI